MLCFRSLVLLTATACILRAEPASPESIFDGRSLAGWEGNPQSWRVEDGAITGEIAAGQTSKKNEFLYWKGEVHDFELTAEFRISGVPSANSGIQFRAQRFPDGHAAGYQADLDDGALWLGRVYDEHGRKLLVERGVRVSIAPDGRRWEEPFAKPESFRSLSKGGDAWNTYRISAAGSHVEIWINGVRCSVFDDHQSDAAEYSGLIAFQLHAGPGPAKVQFRNIRLTQTGRTALPPPLPSKPAPVPAIDPAGTDGKALNLGFEKGTLEGWAAEGDAWVGQPVKVETAATPLRRSVAPSNHAGKFWLGRAPQKGVVATGRLTSDPFTVAEPWASFLVAGSKNPAETRVEIVDAASGEVVFTAAGADSNTMKREVVDLSKAVGKRIRIRIVDDGVGPWGTISFDDFVFHKTRPVFDTSALMADETVRQRESAVLWHLRPNSARPTAVKNPNAQKLVGGMMLVQGFQAELLAAEPDVHQPIAFAIDERGRLWVVEAYSYPKKQPDGKGRDRILIFEDKDGDGAFETRRVFFEGLNLVSGIEVGFGGVWVGEAPNLLFIPDRDRDDRPDGPPQVLLDGWGFQDTHETLNSFTWGPDGWLYGAHGVFTNSLVGKPGTPPEQRAKLRAGIWRYHPVRHEFEVFSTGGSNQWGVDFNELGHGFMTHCRSFHGGGGTSFIIRNGQYWNQANSDYAPYISNRAPDFAPGLKNFLPSSARYDSGEGGAGKPGTTAVYGGHSHVGTMIYLGDNWPAIYRDHLFTHNLHGHQMNQQINVRQGSAYETFHAGYDLLFAPEQTYVPVDLQCGPDGAVYVIDWSDIQHCHNPREELWDRGTGRIYRVSWAENYKPVRVDLSARSDRELAALHTHQSEWYVRTARRLLQERAASRKLEPQALALLREHAGEASGEVRFLRAFWTLHVVGDLGSERLAAALRHPSDAVRAWAVQLATERPLAPAVPAATLVGLARTDSSAMVRLGLASAMPMLAKETAWEIGVALAAHGEDAADRFLPKMVWFGLAPYVLENVDRALDLAARTALPTLADSILWFAGRTSTGREAIAARLAQLPEPAATRAVQVFAVGLESEASLAMPATWPEAARRFEGNASAEARAAAEQLSALFGDKSVLAKTRAVLADMRKPLAERRRALDLLKLSGDPDGGTLYVSLLDDPDLRSAVIPMLGTSRDPVRAAKGLMAQFPTLSETDRTAALTTLTSRSSLAIPMLQSIQEGKFEKRNLTALHARQLRNLRDGEVDALLDKVWGRAADTSADAKASVSRLKRAWYEAPMWAYDVNAGKAVFQRVCSACHTIDGAGGKLGPDLAGSWRNGLDYFLENIVDPNAVVGTDFQLNLITKRDGSVVSGMVEKDSDTALVVRTVTEAVNVPKDQIKERQVTTQSLMPPGLLEGLPEREALELLKFLTQAPK